MRELIKKPNNRREQHARLLATVSTAVLLMSGFGTGQADAAGTDADRPLFWLELGGQLSRQSSDQEKLDPSFFAAVAAVPGLDSPATFETAPLYSVDEFGKFSFRPDDSDWIISASVKYGRSSNKNHVQQQAPRTKLTIMGFPYAPHTHTALAYFGKFEDTNWADSKTHRILDFQVGKDIGLGFFGGRSSSEVSLGVRIGQFSSSSKSTVNADPTIHYPTHPVPFFILFKYHVDANIYWQRESEERGFRGLGPSISWQGSAPIAGNPESSELEFDWGINAAALFGRQKARGAHQLSRYHNDKEGELHSAGAPTYIGPNITHDRSRSLTVPNIGGSIGLSFKSGNAKVSFGYRADLFMNAMDTGIDTRKTSNMLFHGPYASISIGIGN